MDYNFDEIIERRHSGCVKWDTDQRRDLLPMWIADMDFRAAPAIVDALRRRCDHGVFGYTQVMPEYYQAVVDWFAARHGWRIDPEWILHTIGVVPALSMIIQALTRPGDRVIVQSPVYNAYFAVLANTGREPSCNALLNPTGLRYEIDYDDLERRAADPRCTMLLLCNPHNPGGRVWTSEELLRVAQICRRHGVVVVSDEIHGELTYLPGGYTPFGTLPAEYADSAVVCVAPSKSFNIAGLQNAVIVAADPGVRRAIDRMLTIDEVASVNPFGVAAVIAAYTEGGPWLDSLVGYLHANYRLVQDYIASELPQLRSMELEATYLSWIDIRATGLSSDAFTRRLLADEGLMVNSGTMYGGVHGEGFIRLNFACPRSMVADALARLARVARSLR